MKMQRSLGRKVFVAFNYTFCILVGIICLLPLLNVLAISFSGKEYIIGGKVTIFPVGFSLSNYQYVMKDMQFYRSFGVSVERTVIALCLQLFMTVLAGYPLSVSKYKFRQRPIYAWYFIITMIFNGGMIPTYLVVNKTGLMNTIWALVLPGAVPIFNVVLLSNYIKGLPDALSESASLDGAGHWTIMWRIILPLCKPCLATLALFIVVGNWNEWFAGMLYINDANLLPLQTYLRTLIIEVDMNQLSDLSSIANLVSSVGTDSAKVFLAMAPILAVYPFLQKYFVTGIVQGSVKE